MTKASLTSCPVPLDFTYLTDIDMSSLLDRLRHLPSQTVVLYISFFRDAAGAQFLNATLPFLKFPKPQTLLSLVFRTFILGMAQPVDTL